MLVFFYGSTLQYNSNSTNWRGNCSTSKKTKTSIDLSDSPVSHATRFNFDRGDEIDDFDYSLGKTPLCRWAPKLKLIGELLKLSGYKVKVAQSNQELSTLTISWA